MGKCILLSFLLLFALAAYSQSNPRSYLVQAKEKLASGDCDGAKTCYDIYINLGGVEDLNVEKGIKKCNGKLSKTYAVGDDAEGLIGLRGFKIAYLDASGRHGFAIKLEGLYLRPWPTMDEVRILYRNRHSLGLTGEYWVEKEAPFKSALIINIRQAFWTFDFTTGRKHTRIFNDNNRNHIKEMEIFRF